MKSEANTIRVFIVDDEPLARTRVKRMLAKSGYQLCGEAADGDAALTAIARLSPDAVLLDIRMPGTDGMEVAQQINQRPHPPAIIFITAYDEYALRAFRVKAENYLLKPVRREDLIAALGELTKLNKAQLNSIDAPDPADHDGLYVACRSMSGIKRIALSEILYLQAEHKYVTIAHLDGESLCDQSLRELELYLRPNVLRIHRNTLINQHRLERLQRSRGGQHEVYLKGLKKSLLVSRRMVAEVKEFINS